MQAKFAEDMEDFLDQGQRRRSKGRDLYILNCSNRGITIMFKALYTLCLDLDTTNPTNQYSEKHCVNVNIDKISTSAEAMCTNWVTFSYTCI